MGDRGVSRFEVSLTRFPCLLWLTERFFAVTQPSSSHTYKLILTNPISTRANFRKANTIENSIPCGNWPSLEMIPLWREGHVKTFSRAFFNLCHCKAWNLLCFFFIYACKIYYGPWVFNILSFSIISLLLAIPHYFLLFFFFPFFCFGERKEARHEDLYYSRFFEQSFLYFNILFLCTRNCNDSLNQSYKLSSRFFFCSCYVQCFL